MRETSFRISPDTSDRRRARRRSRRRTRSSARLFGGSQTDAESPDFAPARDALGDLARLA